MPLEMGSGTLLGDSHFLCAPKWDFCLFSLLTLNPQQKYKKNRLGFLFRGRNDDDDHDDDDDDNDRSQNKVCHGHIAAH